MPYPNFGAHLAKSLKLSGGVQMELLKTPEVVTELSSPPVDALINLIFQAPSCFRVP